MMANPDVDRPDVHAVEQGSTQLRMVRELAFLVRGEAPGLLEHLVGDRDLPEVVQPAGELQLFDVLVVRSSWRAIPRPAAPRAPRCARVLVLRVDDPNEVLGSAKPRLVLDPAFQLVRAEVSAMTGLYTHERFFPFCFAQ